MLIFESNMPATDQWNVNIHWGQLGQTLTNIWGQHASLEGLYCFLSLQFHVKPMYFNLLKYIGNFATVISRQALVFPSLNTTQLTLQCKILVLDSTSINKLHSFNAASEQFCFSFSLLAFWKKIAKKKKKSKLLMWYFRGHRFYKLKLPWMLFSIKIQLYLSAVKPTNAVSMATFTREL